MLSFLRIIKFALQDIVRNIGLSFMTVLILVLMLMSISTLLFVNILTKEAIVSVRDQIDVSIFINPDATDKQIDEIKSFIKAFPEITDINYISKEKVLEDFKNKHQNDAEIMASLAELGDNPLGSTFVLKTRSPNDYNKIIKALNVPEYEKIIQAKTFGDTEKAISRIQDITSQVEKFGMILSVLFAFIAFLIILNTIRVSIYTQRIEIAIKKLVGATNWFVRGPYLIESLLFTIISVIISLGINLLAVYFLNPYITVIFGRPDILTTYLNSHIILLLGLQFGVVLIITVLSTLLAMGKYLRA